MNDLEWITTHIISEEDREGWIYFYKNKFEGLHPDEAEWFGINNLEEMVAVRRDCLEWFNTIVNEYSFMIGITTHPQLMNRNDYTIMTFEEYMDYVKIWG